MIHHAEAVEKTATFFISNLRAWFCCSNIYHQSNSYSFDAIIKTKRSLINVSVQNSKESKQDTKIKKM